MSPCLLIQVILGGGRRYMFPRDMQDPEYPTNYGERNDGQNLVVEWMKNKKVDFRNVLIRFEFEQRVRCFK